MDELKKKFLQEINNGKIKGAQKLLAKKLGIAESSVTAWIKDNKQPSLDNISKMAKIFKKSESDIEKIFVSNSNFAGRDINITNNTLDLQKELALRDELIKFLKEKIETLEKKLKK